MARALTRPSGENRARSCAPHPRGAVPRPPARGSRDGRRLHAVRQVHTLDRVVIRFAGDSGDGMQLTGDRFTADSAAFGNDISTLPNFPAEIRAPAGHAARRLQLPAALRQLRHHDPGRPARRAGRDEPGRAQGQHRRPAPRRRDHRRHRRLHQAQPGQGRLRRQPARGRLARRLPAARARPDRDDRRGGQGVRAVPQGRLPREEHVRARSAVVALPPPHRGHPQLPRHQVRQQAGHPRRQHHRLQDRVRVRRDHRGLRGHLRGRAGPDAGRPATGRSRATSRWRTGWSPARQQGRTCRCSSAPTRSPRPPTCCTS